jgi:hypothetical protein
MPLNQTNPLPPPISPSLVGGDEWIIKEDIMKAKLLRAERRSLPCKLTEEEVLVAGSELANVALQIDAEEERQKNVKAQMKAILTELTSRQMKLSHVVVQKEEYRDVDVKVMLHEGDMVQEIRTDTDEIIFSRTARDDEKQLHLAPPEED